MIFEGFITKKQVMQICKASDRTIDRWEAEGNFPKRVKLGARKIGWLMDEVVMWIEQRSARRHSC